MSPGSGQPTPILLPQAGNSMEEGTILSWKVKPGDRVKAGDILFELETDKATLEVEAEAEGRISLIVVGEGETAPVKTPVAWLGEDDLAVREAAGGTAPAPVQAEPEPVAVLLVPGFPPEEVRTSDVLSPSRPRVSPVARRAAASLGVDPERAVGTGPGGRVLLKDVEALAAIAPSQPAAASAPVAAPMSQPIQAASTQSSPRPVLPGVRTPMSKMRKAIARSLTLSKQALPHWQLKITIDAGPLLDAHKKAKAASPCSLNDLLVLAVARTIPHHPAFLTQVDGDDLVKVDQVNIGVAVALEAGLVVPVVRNADHLSLRGIAAETKRIVELAKGGKVEAMGEGVFTISNLGMFGVEEFNAIINPPEAAILAVGAAREEAIVKDGALRIGRKMTLVLSSDHRVIDGALAAQFMAQLKLLLESPESLVG